MDYQYMPFCGMLPFASCLLWENMTDASLGHATFDSAKSMSIFRSLVSLRILFFTHPPFSSLFFSGCGFRRRRAASLHVWMKSMWLESRTAGPFSAASLLTASSGLDSRSTRGEKKCLGWACFSEAFEGHVGAPFKEQWDSVEELRCMGSTWCHTYIFSISFYDFFCFVLDFFSAGKIEISSVSSDLM